LLKMVRLNLQNNLKKFSNSKDIELENDFKLKVFSLKKSLN
jgi:hypothetical protein